MEGKVHHELEVGVAASKVWEIYGTLELAKRAPELLPFLLDKVQVLQGEGEVGTVILVVFKSGTPVPVTSFKEKITKLDEAKRAKDVDVVEGGFLDLGFSLYRHCFEIIETGANSCIIKSTVEYKAENADIASKVSPKAVELLAEAIGKHLMESNA